jgi:hypothetical protein
VRLAALATNTARHAGFGTSVDPTGAEYIGVFCEGLPHGRGSHTWPSGERYEGEYIAGKQHGYGKWTHPSGDNYEGYWAGDLKHGVGSYYSSAARRSLYCEWKGGKKVGDPLPGKIDGVRPVWATCFGAGERLYDVKNFDDRGNYHPINDYDEGDYTRRPRASEGVYGDADQPTYDYGTGSAPAGRNEAGYVVRDRGGGLSFFVFDNYLP